MITSLELTPEAMTAYRATMQQRGEREKRARIERRERAWKMARQAATLLKKEFLATQVILFGSLAHEYWFSRTSDIDMAAWGLKKETYFLAVARLQDLSSEFKVDLVAMESCSTHLREAIIKEGMPL